MASVVSALQPPGPKQRVALRTHGPGSRRACRKRLIDGFHNVGHFSIGIVEPIRAPNSVELPSARFEKRLAESVALTSDIPGMVGSAIGFDGQDVPAREVGVPDCEVDSIRASTNLWVERQPGSSQTIMNVDLERVEGYLPVRPAVQLKSVSCHVTQEAMHKPEAGRRVRVICDIFGSEARDKSHSSTSTTDCDVQPALATILKQRPPEVAKLSVCPLAISDRKDDCVPFIALNTLNALHEERLARACAKKISQFEVFVRHLLQRHFNPVLVLYAESDHTEALSGVVHEMLSTSSTTHSYLEFGAVCGVRDTRALRHGDEAERVRRIG